jgi:hypothetical protein
VQPQVSSRVQQLMGPSSPHVFVQLDGWQPVAAGRDVPASRVCVRVPPASVAREPVPVGVLLTVPASGRTTGGGGVEGCPSSGGSGAKVGPASTTGAATTGSGAASKPSKAGSSSTLAPTAQPEISSSALHAERRRTACFAVLLALGAARFDELDITVPDRTTEFLPPRQLRTWLTMAHAARGVAVLGIRPRKLATILDALRRSRFEPRRNSVAAL